MNKDTLNVTCFGEVLMDNFPDGRRIGGAPLNVCYHLNKNGIQSRIVSQVGEDAIGDELFKGIEGLGVDTSYIMKTDRFNTSTVEVHIDADDKVSYEIVEPVAWDGLEYDDGVALAIEQSAAFVFGSLAARSKVTRDTLFKYLYHANWSVFDVNIRPPFYSKEVIWELMGKCRTLKVNKDELEIITAWLSDVKLSITEGLDAILDHFSNIQEILLTMGAQGAIYKGRKELISLPAKRVEVKDTVGSGDSFLAAFLAKKIQGATIRDALEHAVAVSAYVATQHGACPGY